MYGLAMKFPLILLHLPLIAWHLPCEAIYLPRYESLAAGNGSTGEVAKQTERLARAQLEIMHELSERRNESANELTDQVLDRLSGMDEETRLRYQNWVEELRMQEELRLKKIQACRSRVMGQSFSV